MKIKIHTFTPALSSRALAAVVVACALLGSVGCTTRGYQRAAATSGTLDVGATELEATQQQLTRVTSLLDQLVDRPTEDLRPLFNDYTGSVANLEKSVQALESSAAEMESRKQRYLATWETRGAKIESPEIRDQSMRRRDEVTQRFAQVQQSYAEARASFVPLMKDLRDIQRMLSLDLTAAGVDSAGTLLPRIRANATTAREVLSRLARDYRDASASFSPDTMAMSGRR